MSDKLVLFICTGNTCRSPMAEAVFNNLADGGEYYARSAGVYASSGAAASAGAQAAVQRIGLDLSAHRSSPLSYEQLLEAELIVCLTKNHQRFLQERYPDLREKTISFADLTDGDVSDPFGADGAVYERSLRAICDGVEILFKRLQG